MLFLQTQVAIKKCFPTQFEKTTLDNKKMYLLYFCSTKEVSARHKHLLRLSQRCAIVYFNGVVNELKS